jgi:hypothetical protein
VIGPYDVYLADQSLAYPGAWSELVTAHLEQRLRGLRGRTIKVHAGAAYADAPDRKRQQQEAHEAVAAAAAAMKADVDARVAELQAIPISGSRRHRSWRSPP